MTITGMMVSSDSSSVLVETEPYLLTDYQKSPAVSVASSNGNVMECSRRRKVRRLVEKHFCQEEKSNPNFLIAWSDPQWFLQQTPHFFVSEWITCFSESNWMLGFTTNKQGIDFLGRGPPIIFPPMYGLECPALNFLIDWRNLMWISCSCPFILRNLLLTVFNLGKRLLVSWNLNPEVVSSGSWSIYRTLHWNNSTRLIRYTHLGGIYETVACLWFIEWKSTRQISSRFFMCKVYKTTSVAEALDCKPFRHFWKWHPCSQADFTMCIPAAWSCHFCVGNMLLLQLQTQNVPFIKWYLHF